LGEPVKDAVIIASTNRFDHYEIADYGVAKAFAKALGLDADASLLDECIDEAGNMDSEFSKIATGGWFGTGVNEAAIRWKTFCQFQRQGNNPSRDPYGPAN